MNVRFHLLALIFGCRHREVTWPQKYVQRCLGCGSFRFYAIGQPPGPWQREKASR